MGLPTPALQALPPRRGPVRHSVALRRPGRRISAGSRIPNGGSRGVGTAPDLGGARPLSRGLRPLSLERPALSWAIQAAPNRGRPQVTQVRQYVTDVVTQVCRPSTHTFFFYLTLFSTPCPIPLTSFKGEKKDSEAHILKNARGHGKHRLCGGLSVARPPSPGLWPTPLCWEMRG